ncbi:hypothetical protein V8Z80_09155 [Orrella sp. JC864]|uniref:hypothetical protein n=1 Tax=Orrella sp. JC864 TaxID=3120298 RepID=UPI003008C858
MHYPRIAPAGGRPAPLAWILAAALAAALALAARPAAGAQAADEDLIGGVRSNDIVGRLPDSAGGFALKSRHSDPGKQLVRARYQKDDKTAALARIQAVRSRGKIVTLPDGTESPAVGVTKVIDYYKGQQDKEIEQLSLGNRDSGPLNCVQVYTPQQRTLRLVCRTAVLGRMLETQADALDGRGDPKAQRDTLAAFTLELAAALRRIGPGA